MQIEDLCEVIDARCIKRQVVVARSVTSIPCTGRAGDRSSSSMGAESVSVGQ